MTASRSFDAIVVGAGPAGSVCAYHLARSGARVALVDREMLPRHKTCGGGVVGRALAHLPIDLEGLCRGESREVELELGDSEIRVRVRSAEPIIRMTLRSELDAALADAARRQGALLREGFRVRGLRRERGWIELAAGVGEGGALRARFAVAADGAAGATARLAGFGPAPAALPALEVTSASARGDGPARFVMGVPGDGYAWEFPKRGGASLGALATRRAGPSGRQALEGALRRASLEAAEGDPRHGFAIPAAPRPGGCVRQGVLVAGDAAGLVDPLILEGISGAAWSGALAARAVAASLARGADAARLYARGLRPLRRELRVARALAHLLYGHPELRRRALGRFGPALCEAMVAVIAGRSTYLELLARAPRTLLRALGSPSPDSSGAPQPAG